MWILFPAGRTGNSQGQQAGPERVSESTAPLPSTFLKAFPGSHRQVRALTQSAQERTHPSPSPSFPVCPAAWLLLTAPFPATQEIQNPPATPTSCCFQLPWLELCGGVHVVLRQSTPDSFISWWLCHSSQENKIKAAAHRHWAHTFYSGDKNCLYIWQQLFS